MQFPQDCYTNISLQCAEKMASQCLFFMLGYITLCMTFFLLTRKCSPRSLSFLLLDMLPVLFLLYWVELQKRIAEKHLDHFEAVSFALILISFARCASHFHVDLLAELAWICSVGVLIGAHFCWAVVRELGSSALSVLGSVLFAFFCTGIWLLYTSKEDKCSPEKRRLWKNSVDQFQTTITRVLIIAELSLLVMLGLAQLLANPTQNSAMAGSASVLMYMSAILTDATNRFFPLTKEALSNTYYLLIQASLLLETASIIC